MRPINEAANNTRWSEQVMAPAGDIQVLFADNQPLILSGLKSAVADHSDIQVLAECANRDRLLDTVRSHSPHVLLVSAEFLEEDLEILERLVTENEETRVILLTSRKDPEFLEEALRCGARGIFQRERPVRYVPMAIRKVMNGGFWFEQTLAERMLGELVSKRNKAPDPDERKIAAITAREREVIALVCQGLRNKEISDRLFISDATVSHHLTSIFRKLEVGDRMSLVIYAVKKCIVTL